MSIKIIKPGVSATLQDTGRSGHRGIGIGSGGAMDMFAMKVANFLCGNDESEAVIEINFPAPEILFEQDAIISITGADFSGYINATAVSPWRTLYVKKNTVLKFRQPISGARSYLAVQGGWQVEKWLGSYSTHLKLGTGGLFGRALQKEDRIHYAGTNFSFNENKIFPWFIAQHELDKMYEPSHNIRCIHGVEYDLLNDSSKHNFDQQNFIISNQSDRMGYRFINQALALQQPIELVSSAVDTGTIQLLPSGDCVILMADHQTTGGYPRIASIIKADMPKLAQAKPGQSINFSMISIQEAEENWLHMHQTLKEIKTACHLNLKKYL